MQAEALLAAIMAQGATPEPTRFTFTRTIDRNWGETFGSGGGADPTEFVYNGVNWELYQIVPFVGANIVTSQRAQGDCYVQMRNRDISRGAMTVDMLPDRIIIARSEWLQSPWMFNRTTRFGNVGSGNNARVGAGYAPTRTPASTPSAEGISNGDAFQITLEWDQE